MHVRKGLIKNEVLFHKLNWALIPKPLRWSIKQRWRVIIAVNFQFKQLEGRTLRNIRASTGFESVTSAIPVRCSTNWAVKPVTLGARSICWVHTFTCSEMMNSTFIFHIISLQGKVRTQQIDLAPNVWLHSSVGWASHRYRRGHGFKSRWSPDIFQVSSFQLLKLENLLRWSFFTFLIYILMINKAIKCCSFYVIFYFPLVDV